MATDQNHEQAGGPSKVKEVSPQDKERAQQQKEAGNQAFRSGNHREAVRLYTEAIGE